MLKSHPHENIIKMLSFRENAITEYPIAEGPPG